MPDAGPISYDVRERIGYLTLQRPAALNAIDEEMLAALEDVVPVIRDDESAKALVLTGSGDAFCVGLDIELLGRCFDDTAYFRRILDRFKLLLLGIEDLPIPVVTAVNGLARAGGFELMLACDLVVVATEARVADHHLSFGVVPGGGATQRAPRKIGDQRARHLIFTGRWLDGPAAVDAGLALRAVPHDDLPTAVEDLVGVFRDRSRACLAATKQAMNEGRHLPLAQALDVEHAHFFRYLEDVPSSREGYLAFREQRRPEWP